MILEMGKVVADRYEIVSRIGMGGMAIVYKAKDRKLDRFVTFKVMREEFANDDEFLSRFVIEARAAAKLNHQNIVNVYDVGQEGNINYIVMEYIDGVTLKDLILKRAPFNNDEILGVAIQISTALEEAHTHNIVHRDIKPQNILVTATGVLKVTDFGIARATSANTTTAGTNTMGSVHYFSPEQARGGFVDYRSDIYSLGIIMYEMSTGHLPYDGDTPVAVALKHINDKLPDIRMINDKITDSIVQIILKATEKLTSLRYQSCQELNVDLKHALAHETGEFVQRTENMYHQPTIRLTQEDMAIIKKQSKPEPVKEEKPKVVEEKDEDEADDDEVDEDFDDDDLDEEVEKGSEKKVIIAAVITSIVIIGIIVFAVISIYNNQYRSNLPSGAAATEVTVPDLTVDLDLEEASRVLADLGLFINETNRVYDDEIPEGKIVSQDVDAGTTVQVKSIVSVVTSLGSNKIEVPDLTGKSANTIHDFLSENKLMFDITEQYVYSDKIATYVVVSQEPEAGDMAEAGSEIILYISQGPEPSVIKVPDVSGLTEAEAIKKLQSLGLVISKITRASSEKYAEGLVANQTVASGKEVLKGTQIELVVSQGKGNSVPATIPTRKVKVLKVDPTIPEEIETVTIKILRNDGSKVDEIYNEEVPSKDFPKTYEVDGKGKVEFLVYINDIFQGRQPVDFDSEE